MKASTCLQHLTDVAQLLPHDVPQERHIPHLHITYRFIRVCIEYML